MRAARPTTAARDWMGVLMGGARVGNCPREASPETCPGTLRTPGRRDGLAPIRGGLRRLPRKPTDPRARRRAGAPRFRVTHAPCRRDCARDVEVLGLVQEFPVRHHQVLVLAERRGRPPLGPALLVKPGIEHAAHHADDHTLPGGARRHASQPRPPPSSAKRDVGTDPSCPGPTRRFLSRCCGSFRPWASGTLRARAHP